MAPWSRLSSARQGGSSAADSAEARRARAFREMFIAGLCSFAGVAIVAFAMKAPERRQALMLVGAIPLTIGIAAFLHGLWRYLRE